MLAVTEREYSFTELCISEAVGIVRKNQCCRRAFTLGVLFGACSISGGDNVTLTVRTEGLCSLLQKLIKEQFGREAAVMCKSDKKQTYEMSFISSAAAALVERSLDFYNSHMKCTACRGAFLCGILCSCTSINDPKKDYYLSIRVSPEHKDAVEAALRESDVRVSLRTMNGKAVFYMRASTRIEDFLAVCGMQRLLFDFMNQKIENEYRNNTNRAINIEVNNIKKTVASAKKYIKAIEWLRENDRLTGLDAVLYEAAKLREENPECSLSALGAMMTPAVSKSGVLHRLNRIYAIYEQAKNKI